MDKDLLNDKDLVDDVDAGNEGEWGDTLAALDQLEATHPRDAGDWVDEGVQDVDVATLPQPEGIDGPQDFHKVSAEEMKAGLERLQEMKPVIESGQGASSDYWADVDAANGSSYADGYRRVYDAFYGQDAIRIVDDQGRLDIVNGRHRIALAKEMGIETLPARMIRRK